jgi:methionine-rich copper-binding protein CopC
MAKRKIMHSGRHSPLIHFVFGAIFLFLIPALALAHAVVLESSPPPKGAIKGPDVPIKLRFNVRIDASRSRLTLVRPDGSAQPLVIGKPASADTLSAQANSLPAGDYRLRWQVLASDGHITRGEIPFTVTPS